MSRHTKMKVDNAAVISIVMYRSESCTWVKEYKRRPNGFDRRCPRRILGIHWMQRVTNEDARIKNWTE